MRIIAFGDSITWGGYDSQGGWADRIRRQLIEEYVRDDQAADKWQLINLGIGGDTSTGVVARIGAELEARKRGETIVVIAIGINDSRVIGPERTDEVSIEDFENNLDQSIEIAKAYASKILVVGLTPVAEENIKLTDGELSYKHYFYSNERIQRYDAVASKIAGKHEVTKLDVFETLRTMGNDALFRDGLHLSDAGHERLAQLIDDQLSSWR